MTATTYERETADDRGDLARKLALLFGVAFLAVGVIGFIPGLTTNFSDLGWASDSSKAEILGLFQTSVLHNIVHLLFGVVLVAASRGRYAARGTLLGAGLIYVVLFVYGLFVGGSDNEKWVNFVPVNNADDWLHLALAAGMLGAWAITRPRHAAAEHVRERPVGGAADEPLAREPRAGEPEIARDRSAARR